MITPITYSNNIKNNTRNQITTPHYTPAFGGLGFAAKTISKLKDGFYRFAKINLHLDVAENKAAFDYLKKKFNKLPDNKVVKVYCSILDSTGTINSDALSILKLICDNPKNIKQKVFSSKENKNAVSKYGLDFMANIFEAVKDKNKNHSIENLDFVNKLLSTHVSANPESYFNILKVSKNSDGIIPKANKELYSILNKAKKMEYYDSFRNKDGIIDDYLRDYVLDDIKNHNGKIDTNVLDIVKSVGKAENAKDILNELTLKRANVKSSDLEFCIYHSKDKDGNISAENFKRLSDVAETNSKLLKYYQIFRDNNKHIRTNNINFVKVISPEIADEKVLAGYAKTLADKDGIIPTDCGQKLVDFFKNYPHSNKHETLIYCLDRVKNADGSVNWDYLKTFYNVKSKIHDDADPHNIFHKNLSSVKDKNGNIVPEFADEIKKMMEDDLLGEISYILRASKKLDGALDKQVLGTAKNIIKSAFPKERIDIAKFMTTCRDKNGDIDTWKIKVLDDIQKAGIKSNILKISKALHNPDDTSSKRGLDLITHLRKNSHHQIEDDLPEILRLCRDNTGFLNSNNIDAVKTIQAWKPRADLSTLLKIARNKNGEIDETKLKGLTGILKQFHGRRLNEDNIQTVIKIATNSNGECDLDVMKLLARIQKSGEKFDSYNDLMPAFKAFAKYSHVTSFDQLNLLQKRDIMRKITDYHSEIQSGRFNKYLDIKILPKNGSDYCTTLGRLSHSIGINVKPLESKIKAGFFDSMQNMSNPKSEFMKLDFDNNIPKLNLTYPLEDFQNDVWNVVKNLSYGERTKSIDYFGFELKNKSNRFIMNGFPSADKPDGRLALIKDKTVQDAITKLTPYIIKFTQANNVYVKNNPNLSNDLTNIVKAFPEFLTTIKKEQHPTHDYTLDIHLLKVLQGVFKNPEYQKLSETSKKQIQIVAFLHDLTKQAGAVDRHHPENSAFDTYYLLNKMEMSEKEKLKIYQIIKNHAWLEKYNNSANKADVAKNLAFEFRQGDAFKLISILTDADLKGIKKNNGFFKKYAQDLYNAKKHIEPLVYDLQKTAINLPQTKIPKAHKLNTKSKLVTVINRDGIKNTVIDLSQADGFFKMRRPIDLKSIGFEENVYSRDLNLLVHGLDNKDNAAMFQALGVINSDALLSTSYINYGKGNYKVFRQQGFVLDVPSTDIHAGYWRDFGSGYRKDKHNLFSTYLFSNNFARNYFSDELKKKLKLSDSAYIDLLRKIEDLSITQLDIKFPQVAKAYRNIFTNMNTSIRSFGRNYNEILVSRPKIQALFCYRQNAECLPAYLRRYAEKNDIPILYFGF